MPGRRKHPHESQLRNSPPGRSCLQLQDPSKLFCPNDSCGRLYFSTCARTLPSLKMTGTYARSARNGGGRPAEHCLPHGVPAAMLYPGPFKIVETPGLTLILYEDFVDFRQIFTDGRKHPKSLNPAWYGYSVGKWIGETFEVE